MTAIAILQLLVFIVVLLALVKPLGAYMARVYEKQPCGLDKILGPLERLIYRLCGIDPTVEMSWKHYVYAVLTVNFLGLIVVYGLLRLQYYLPLNPQAVVGTSPGQRRRVNPRSPSTACGSTRRGGKSLSATRKSI